MNIEMQCPLNAKCESVKKNKLIRCAWYTKIVGKDPQSTKEYDKWECAMAWLPILMVENAQTNRGQTGALESFRNEMVSQNDTLIKVGIANVEQLTKNTNDIKLIGEIDE